jgi:spermidine synthase
MKRNYRVLFGPLAGAILVFGTAVLALLIPGYSHVRQMVSAIRETGSPARVPVRVAVVSVVLFLSGASALLFETLWLRLSGLAFGNSVWAAALILSSFMAGLGLGSAIAASLTLRRARPLRVYAGLEMAVAVFGCTLVFGIPLLGQLLRPIFQTLWTDQPLLNVLRFSISFLILLIPTTAMGLTLPVLLEDPLLKRHEFGPTVGLLYGFNTLGAVAGALAGEAYLVRAYGLFGSGLGAAAISCTAAVIAWFFSAANPETAGQTSPPPRFRLPFAKPLPWNPLFASMAAGAILLALEVTWFRFLRLYVTSTATAFAIMLAVVLIGIGLGGISFSVIPRRFASPRQAIPILLLLAALGTLLSYMLFPVPVLPPNKPALTSEFWQQIGQLSSALMFPVAFLSGALLPAIVTCVQSDVSGRMNSAGLTILFNTIGAALGPLLAGFVLLPQLGFQKSLILSAAAYATLALLTSQKSNWSLWRISGRAMFLLSAAFIVTLSIFPYHRDEIHFTNGRRPYQVDGSFLVRKIEGTADTVQLLRRDLYGEPYYYRLVSDCSSMSATLPRSQRYMRLFVYLPLILRPESENALLVGYGVGVTAGAFMRDSHLKHLDVVDISKEVLDLADSYSGPGYANPLRDPRVTTFVQDGRFFLQACPKHYDIITGEPPPLKAAGTVNLYTEQFFSLMKGRLKNGGIVSFWLPLYQLRNDETKAILRAFHNVFQNASLWATNDLEWIMIGIKPPLPKPDQALARRLWNDRSTGSDLVRIGVEVPEQMSTLFIMDGEEIDRLTQGVGPLTDFFPKRLTDAQPDLAAAYRFGYNYLEHSAALRRFLSSRLIEEIWPNEWKKSLEPLFFVREAQYRAEMLGGNWLAALDLYLRRSRLRTPVLAAQDSDEFRLALAEKFAGQSAASMPIDALRDLVAGALAGRDIAGAIQLLEQERERGFATINDLFLLIYLYCLHGNIDQAEALAAAEAGSIQKDGFVNWLWGDLQAEFGFRPPS